MNFLNPLKSAYNAVGNAAVKMHVQYPKTYEYLHNISAAGHGSALQGSNPVTAMAMSALSPAVSGIAKHFSPTTASRINSAFSGATKLANAIRNRALIKHANEGSSGFGYNMQYKPKIQFKPVEVPQLATRMASDFKGVSDIPANLTRNSNLANVIPSVKVDNVGPFKSLEFSPNSMPYKFDMDDQYYKDSTGNRQNPFRRDSANIDFGLNIKGSF